MRLSEKIMDLRKRSGWSQEELAERLGISRQSVSKWETGESIPDIDKIIRMSELWNVSTDYLLKDDDSGDQEQKTRQSRRQVSREEAEDFLALSREAAPRIATGVLLCILSPVCLMLLAVLSEKNPVFGNALIPENVVAGIGVTVLLVLVAIAVALFITAGMRLSKYEYMEQECLELPEDMTYRIADEKESFAAAFRCCVTIGVVLCIVGVIPLLVVSIFTQTDFFMIISVCILLVFVAVGVFILIYACMINASYDKLLQTGDYTPGKKKAEKLSGAYWSIVVAIYLGYSFFTGKWGFSWIIFPVAGVLYGAVRKVLDVMFHFSGK